MSRLYKADRKIEVFIGDFVANIEQIRINLKVDDIPSLSKFVSFCLKLYIDRDPDMIKVVNKIKIQYYQDFVKRKSNKSRNRFNKRVLGIMERETKNEEKLVQENERPLDDLGSFMKDDD